MREIHWEGRPMAARTPQFDAALNGWVRDKDVDLIVWCSRPEDFIRNRVSILVSPLAPDGARLILPPGNRLEKPVCGVDPRTPDAVLALLDACWAALEPERQQALTWEQYMAVRDEIDTARLWHSRNYAWHRLVRGVR